MTILSLCMRLRRPQTLQHLSLSLCERDIPVCSMEGKKGKTLQNIFTGGRCIAPKAPREGGCKSGEGRAEAGICDIRRNCQLRVRLPSLAHNLRFRPSPASPGVIASGLRGRIPRRRGGRALSPCRSFASWRPSRSSSSFTYMDVLQGLLAPIFLKVASSRKTCRCAELEAKCQ